MAAAIGCVYLEAEEKASWTDPEEEGHNETREDGVTMEFVATFLS